MAAVEYVIWHSSWLRKNPRNFPGMRGTRYGFRSLRSSVPLLPFFRRYFIFASKLSKRWNLVLHMINSQTVRKKESSS